MLSRTTSARQRISDAEDALKAEKIDMRRAELADAALETLGQLGYARTSLREIAQNTPFSHGVFHHYFSGKLDLLSCSVRRYKMACVTRYDVVVATATTREELLEGFLVKLGETMRQDAAMHRLWYDLRAQALFEPAFRTDVMEIDRSQEDMIWRVVLRYAAFNGALPSIRAPILYALIDGLFQKYLLQHLAGDATAIPALIAEVRTLMPMVG